MGSRGLKNQWIIISILKKNWAHKNTTELSATPIFHFIILYLLVLSICLKVQDVTLTKLCFWEDTPPWNLNLRNCFLQGQEPHILIALDMEILKMTWERVWQIMPLLKNFTKKLAINAVGERILTTRPWNYKFYLMKQITVFNFSMCGHGIIPMLNEIPSYFCNPHVKSFQNIWFLSLGKAISQI